MKLILSGDELFPEIVRMLDEGHTVTLKTKGSSMRPFIVGGRDSVVLEAVHGEVCTGDVVLACIPGRGYILHRVYRREGDACVLMGDGNLCATERCSRDAICGRVTQIIRQGRVVDCASRRERLLARWWRHLLPLRRVLLKLMS